MGFRDSKIVMIIFGVLFLLGLIETIAPRYTWRLFESWKAKSEPSKAYFFMRRLGGIVLILILVFIWFFPQIMGFR